MDRLCWLRFRLPLRLQRSRPRRQPSCLPPLSRPLRSRQQAIPRLSRLYALSRKLCQRRWMI